MYVLKEENAPLFESVERHNLIRQYELLTNCVEIGLSKDVAPVDKYLLWTLNHVAVANISQHAGRFRKEPVYVGSHVPPHFKGVDSAMDRCITTIQENWFTWSGTELAAYALWRVNWIHPFIEGNGRTARAFCYYLLCVRAGSLLPGRPILPERIRKTRDAYVQALQAADQAWENGHLDFTAMEDYLAYLVKLQLQSP
ncbi:MAG: Fic family protein [Rhodobacter sp.]|nr:Fic family protein [Rhodobacter sp.]